MLSLELITILVDIRLANSSPSSPVQDSTKQEVKPGKNIQ